MRERFMFALRAAGAVAAALSNLLPVFAAILWYAAGDAKFRAGFVLAASHYEPTMAAVWKITAAMLLLPVFFVFFAALFGKKRINNEALIFFTRHHIGRVYFIYPLRAVLYAVSFFTSSTPR